MTPRSWEHWKERYERRRYEVLAPAYPGFEVEVKALRQDPSPIAQARVPDTVAHLESVMRGLDRPPLLIGHSFGGLLLQLLLDRGLGTAGVAIDSAPAEGIRKVPPTQLKALVPAFENPANRHRAVPFTPEQFHYAFTNTLSEAESAEVYERYYALNCCNEHTGRALLATA
jgi:pimeloyl-ACP methyl ester carboxylesterase